MSKAGRFVVFESNATNLVPNDTNGRTDIFLRDRSTGTTSRVSVNSSGTEANGTSEEPSISADGRYVAFASTASNLVEDDANGVRDIFVRDQTMGITTRVSVDSLGAGGNGRSAWPSISADGRYVAFASNASNLVPDDTNGSLCGGSSVCYDTFVHDGDTGTTTRVSVKSGGEQAQCCSYEPSISADGRYVAFRSGARDLVTDDTNLQDDVFVHDRTARTTTRVSVSSSGAESNGWSGFHEISDDGRYVVFESGASNLEAGDTNGQEDVFVHELFLRVTTRISRDSEFGDIGNGQAPSISGNGRYVSYSLGTGNDSLPPGIMVVDRATGKTYRVSVNSSGQSANGISQASSISHDGRFVTFQSDGTNLAEQDTNGVTDAFFRNRGDDWAAISVSDEQTYGDGQGTHAENPTEAWGDPVNTATGSFVTSVVDVSLPSSAISFVLERTYTSADEATGPLGPGWSYSYGVSLSIGQNGDVTLRAEEGQRVAYIRQPDGTFVGPPGARSSLSAVVGGYELLRHDMVTYRFETSGRLVSLRDRNGQQFTLSYGSDGNLATVTDSVGRVITFTHDASGWLTQVALPDGRTVRYAYTSGSLTSVVDIRGETTTYAYDAGGRLNQIIDPLGQTVLQNTYGPDGRIVEQVDALGNRTTLSWNPATQTTTMTDARGNVWKDVYWDNVLVQQADPLGNSTTYGHDPDLNLASLTDARERQTRMVYDAAGNLLQTIAPPPFSYVESRQYNARNDVVSYTDGRGNTTTYDYDANGNLIRETRPGSLVMSYGRDPATGRITSVTDFRGETTHVEYDTDGNLTRITSPLGNVTSMGYDAGGRVTSVVEPRGNEAGANPADFRWTFSYDSAGNLLTRTSPLGKTRTYTYDSVGRLKSRTDPKGRTTSWTYNAAGDLTSVTAPDGTVTSYTHDKVGNVATRTDANGHVTTYTYDPHNRLASITSPLGQVWTYTYDPVGHLTKMVTPAGNVTADPSDGTISYSYDTLNRLTRIDHSGTTPDVTYAYDAANNRTSMSDGAGTVTYTYDPLNRVTQISRGSNAFSYTYDGASNITSRVYPDGTTINYAHDADGRLASVASGGLTTSHGYDSAGHVTATALPNGYVEARQYDRDGRLIDVRNTKGGNVLSRFTYTLDDVGNPTSVATSTGTITYAYDVRDRLAEVCFSQDCSGSNDPFIRYSYDGVGNLLSESRPSGTTSYTYNAGDQLLSQTGPSGTIAYAYDQDGNRTAAGGATYAFDVAGRMTSATVAGTTTTYSYDGNGSRIQASTGTQASKITKYLWDPNGRLPELAMETDGRDALLRRYIHGTDLVSMFTGGNSYFYHYDALGSVINLTSSSGATQWTYEYEPYGTLRSEVKGANKAPTNLIRFTGELYDTSPALYHLRARQYDPRSAQFLAQDPVLAPFEDPYISAYAYVGNRPVVLADPSGERAESPKRGPGGCWIMSYAPVEDYLTGWVCAPPGFPYVPDLMELEYGRRAGDPWGECTDAKVLLPEYMDPACLTHDYGYDLVRFGTTTEVGWIDEFFHGDMMAICDTRPWYEQQSCMFYAGTTWWTVVLFGDPEYGQPIETG